MSKKKKKPKNKIVMDDCPMCGCVPCQGYVFAKCHHCGQLYCDDCAPIHTHCAACNGQGYVNVVGITDGDMCVECHGTGLDFLD